MKESDIVRNAVSKESGLLKNQRFLDVLLKDEIANAFQEFLARNRLSSHAWIFSSKPDCISEGRSYDREN